MGQASFVPTNLPGCVLWLRADLGISIGTGVSAWADQSGTGDPNKNVSQATGAKQPVYISSTAGFNNRPTLQFTAANTSTLRSGVWSVAPSQPITWIVAASQSSALAQYMVDGLSNNVMGIVWRPDLTEFELDAGAGLMTGASTYQAGPLVYGAVFNGASSAIYINNSQTAAATGSAGTGPSTGMNIGAAGGGAANPFSGNIAEIVAYTGTLTPAQSLAVFSYMGSRYGIATT